MAKGNNKGRKVKEKAFDLLEKLVYWFCSHFIPVSSKKVLFLSDIRKEIGGNYLPLYDALNNKGFKVICDFRSTKSKRESRKKRLFRAFRMATAGFIVLEDFNFNTEWITIRKNQELVQLWHAPGAFKRFAWSRKEVAYGFKINPAYEKITKATVSAEAIRKDYAEAFHIDISRVLSTGLPRTDCFFDETYIDSIRPKYEEKYPVLKGKKIVLIAPTYRGNSLKKAYYDLDRLNIERIHETLGDEYVTIFKWHPAMQQRLKKNKKKAYKLEPYEGNFLDLSYERDINELLMIADVLITDYSSVIFEYELLHKPIIYYWYDVDEYDEGRGFFYDLEDYVYGTIAYDFEQLMIALKDPQICEEKRSKFHEKFMSACDGHATERVIEQIFLRNK